MTRRALITGIGGFAGDHLARCLLQHGIRVSGTHRPGHTPAGLPPSLPLYPADLSDSSALNCALAEEKPDWVFHLAGLSSEIEARRQPDRAMTVNLLGTLHLFSALREGDLHPRVLTSGSSAEYGEVHPEENPIGEAQPLRPASPYGVSKAAQGLLALQHYREHGLEVIHTRAFNHTGPGQRDGFSASSFARQIAEAEAGLRPPEIEVGNLSARRDLSDVRDVCRAYIALMEAGRPGEVYNVGSGEAVPMGDVVKRLQSMSAVPVRVLRSPTRMRPVDVPLLVADTSKLRRETGWEPRIPLEQTLADLLASWRERVSGIATRSVRD